METRAAEVELALQIRWTTSPGMVHGYLGGLVVALLWRRDHISRRARVWCVYVREGDALSHAPAAKLHGRDTWTRCLLRWCGRGMAEAQTYQRSALADAKTAAIQLLVTRGWTND